MGVVVIINFPYSTCISSFFSSSRNKNKNKKPKWRFFYFMRRAPKLRYYGDVIHSFYWKSAVEHDGGV